MRIHREVLDEEMLGANISNIFGQSVLSSQHTVKPQSFDDGGRLKADMNSVTDVDVIHVITDK